jgi:rubrerythrin
MFERLKRTLRGVTGTRAFYECRHCGTTVERPTLGCPSCDSGEIARYRI